MEDTAIKPLISTLAHGMSLRFRPVAWLALLGLLCTGCQTTALSTRPINSDDVDLSVTLPRTLENVWYRTSAQPANFIPFAAEGTLLVTTDALLFNGSAASLSISARSIRQVVWGTMDGDLQNQWAEVYFVEDGVEKIVGFTAANGYRYHTSNKELYSAIVVAHRSQPRP